MEWGILRSWEEGQGGWNEILEDGALEVKCVPGYCVTVKAFIRAASPSS